MHRSIGALRALVVACVAVAAPQCGAALPLDQLDTSLSSRTVLGGQAPPVVFKARVVREMRHNASECFTQGLVLSADARAPTLVESCGMWGASAVQERDLESMSLKRRVNLPPRLFAEGIAALRGVLFQLTYKARVLLAHNASSLAFLGSFRYPGSAAEGWGLASDGRALLVSDGTPALRVWSVSWDPRGAPTGVSEDAVLPVRSAAAQRVEQAAAGPTGRNVFAPRTGRRPLSAGSAPPVLPPGGGQAPGYASLHGLNAMTWIPHAAAAAHLRPPPPPPTSREAALPAGYVMANVYGSPCVAVVELPEARVAGWVVTQSLYRDNPDPDKQVLNGVAFDAASGHLLLTGKQWPVLYEVDFKPDPGEDPAVVESSICRPHFFGSNMFMALRGLVGGG